MRVGTQTCVLRQPKLLRHWCKQNWIPADGAALIFIIGSSYGRPTRGSIPSAPSNLSHLGATPTRHPQNVSDEKNRSRSLMLVPKSQWPFLVIVCSVLSAENQVNPRYDSGRTHPYHPKLRPHFFTACSRCRMLIDRRWIRSVRQSRAMLADRVPRQCFRVLMASRIGASPTLGQVDFPASSPARCRVVDGSVHILLTTSIPLLFWRYLHGMAMSK